MSTNDPGFSHRLVDIIQPPETLSALLANNISHKTGNGPALRWSWDQLDRSWDQLDRSWEHWSS
jgi:hypothetical protein